MVRESAAIRSCRALRASPCGLRSPVGGGRALDDVEELPERDVDEGEDHRHHVEDPQEFVSAAVQEDRREGEQQTGHGDDDQGDQRHQVVAEALAGDGAPVLHTAPEEVAGTGDDEHGCDVQAVEHQPAEDVQRIEADDLEAPDAHLVTGAGAGTGGEGEPAPGQREGDQGGEDAAPEDQLVGGPAGVRAGAEGLLEAQVGGDHPRQSGRALAEVGHGEEAPPALLEQAPGPGAETQTV